MIIQTIKISDLKPAPYNPRTATHKQSNDLGDGLKKFGLVEPIVWNKRSGHIVGGHFRVREMKRLGHKEVECSVVDLNNEDERELNIRLNANTGSFDYDILANQFDSIKLAEWGLETPDQVQKPERQRQITIKGKDCELLLDAIEDTLNDYDVVVTFK